MRCERRHGEPTRPGRDCPGFVILVVRNIYIQQYFETVEFLGPAFFMGDRGPVLYSHTNTNDRTYYIYVYI